MKKSKYKRWQWWLCVATLSPIILISLSLGLISAVMVFLSEKIDASNYIDTPKFILKFVKWGSGD